MIDFRYHLVSLISVFLALAVGIVLGAGPLKESIGDTLTGEVDALRERSSELRTELDEAAVALARSQSAFVAVSDDLLAGTLEGRRVAVVQVGSVAGGVLDEVAGRLAQAGATVTAQARLTDQWVDPGRASFRRSLAGTVLEYLDPPPADDAGTTTELAEAVVQGLSNARPEDPDLLTEDAGVLLQLLTDAELLELSGDVVTPADGVVVVAGRIDEVLEGDDEAQATTDPAEVERVDAWIDAAREIASAGLLRTAGAVVAGYDVVDDGLLTQLREGVATTNRISTVAEVQHIVGQVSVPLALAERMAGGVGHYGADGDATAPVPPRTVLDPIERVPTTPEDEADAPETPPATEGTEETAG